MADSAEPRLPDVVAIPQQAIREWIQIPPAQALSLDLTRSTIDHLFVALRKMADSQAKFHACLIRYSQGDLVGANGLLVESQTSLVESENRLSQFMTEVMLSATRGP